MAQHERGTAYYHLPGLFEFYELYRVFLPLFREHREYFYDWCEIGSVYGAPADCIWGGGRTGFGDAQPHRVLALMQEYGISARLTFSNSLLREEHLADRKCNALCALFEKENRVQNGVIVHSDLLLDYLKRQYPGLYFVSSTTKVLTDFQQLRRETEREEFRYVVPDFRLNKSFAELDTLPQDQKDKVEFLCNECCWYGCRDRKHCYENVSRKNLGEDCPDHRCTAPGAVWVRKGGEWAIIHRCKRCGKLSSNRVAADDNPMKLMSIAMKPLCSPPFPLDYLEEMTALMGGDGRMR